MEVADPSKSLDILVRDPEGFSIWNGPPFINGQPSIKHDKVLCTSTKFSEDGSKLLVMRSDSFISTYDCKSFKEIRSLQVPNVLASSISPCGTYLQTFQKATSPQDKNMIVWKIDTGEAVYQMFQKNMTKATWPSICFSSDETVVSRLATNEVQFFDPSDFSKGIVHRVRVPGIAAFELSKTPGLYVAAFVPESKGMPANVQIFTSAKEVQSQPVARRSFFRCSSVQLNWNRGSTGLLVVVQSDVDKTNQSYYGESKLSYLTTDGTHEGLVPLRKEGPVHDVQWSYTGNEFAVVYGFMPAMATIFDKKCNPLLELGIGPYNTIRWNPKGKFVCLAGFGNLPGDMAFWDYSEKKRLGTTKAELSVTSEWSPDGRFFMTATTAPRLQVDNGIKIFHHTGSLYFKRMFDKLFQAEWKPESPYKFGDIAETLKALNSLKIEDTTKQGQGSKTGQVSSRAAASDANPPVHKPTAYRPPHAKAAAAIQAEEIFFERILEQVLAEYNSSTRLEQTEEVVQSEQVAPDLIKPSVSSEAPDKSISGLADEYVAQDISLVVSDQSEQVVLSKDKAVGISFEILKDLHSVPAVQEFQGFKPYMTKPIDVPSPPPVTTEFGSSSAPIVQPVDAGKELILSYINQSEQDEPENEHAIDFPQRDVILSTLHSVQSTLSQLKNDQFITSNTVERVRDSLEDKMKSFSRDLSDLAKDLDSKYRKSTINLVQSQELLSTKIDSVQATMTMRFDSIETKLETIIAALFSRSKSDVIDKKGESSSKSEEDSKKRASDEPDKKRSEPDSSRRDKGPDAKRYKSQES